MTESSLDALRQARAELNAVIDDIQQVPGFTHFLAAPTFDDIADAANDHPLVYLAAAESGGVALVVRGTSVTDVDLPLLTRDEVAERTRAYLDRYREHRDAEGAGGAGRKTDEVRRTALADWNDALLAVTSWLWDAAMEPVLAALFPDPDREVPVATFVPGGLLGLLPLHAAWHPDQSRPTGREHVLDRLRIAYAPNARALSAARARASEVTGRRMLAVAPGKAADLPMPPTEALAARVAFPSAGSALQPRPTATGFLDGMADADVIHVACHGIADLETPLDSRLILAPGVEVTLATIMARSIRIRLAVLSACETLLPGTELPDEVVSLPTGLIQAGAAGVIASMWAVPDLASTILMVEFYRHWRADPLDPGTALQSAQTWLRDTSYDERIGWYETRREWPPRPIAERILDRLAVLSSGQDTVDGHALSNWAAFAHVGA